MRLREFVWVGGCVTTPAMWASPPGRRRRSVHKSVEMAPRGRFGAFVYTVGPWAWVVGGLGIAIVYTNGRIGPLRAGLGRLCTLLGCCAVVDRRGDAGVYTDRRKWALGAVSGHLCTLLRLARIVRATVGTQECTQIDENSLSGPFWDMRIIPTNESMRSTFRKTPLDVG